MKVITSHPGKQVVAYSIAEQLFERDCLAAHIASVYYDSSKIRYALWRNLPWGIGQGVDKELMKRSSAGLPARVVRDGPWLELILRGLGRHAWLSQWLAERRAYRLVDRWHDRRAARWIVRQTGIDAVVAFQGSALRTLGAARSIKATAILMATHPLNHHRIVQAEYDRLGCRNRSESEQRLIQEAQTADYLVSASRSTSEALHEIGIPAARIKEIPYGLSPKHFSRCEPIAPAKPRTRFLFVGKLSAHKGLHILRDAFHSLESPGSELTLIGRPVGDCERRLVREWNDRRVAFVEEVDDIDQMYAGADVFVFPSLVEGFGMVILEAMAAGLPVIVTDRCATVVRNGVDGFVVSHGSAGELREKMEYLASHETERVRLGENARQRAGQFTWNRFGDEFEKWLREVSKKGMAARKRGLTPPTPGQIQ
jgi:glycosyltransferase involved in cell wall biosynthesis